jgi:hypothetical protein
MGLKLGMAWHLSWAGIMCMGTTQRRGGNQQQVLHLVPPFAWICVQETSRGLVKRKVSFDARIEFIVRCRGAAGTLVLQCWQD